MRDEFDSKPLGQEEDDDEEGDGLIILKVIHDEDGEELLSTCDSEEELEAAYAAFMEDLLEDEEEKDDEEPIFISVTAEDGEELTGLALGKAVNSDVVAYGSSAVVVDRTGVLHLIGLGNDEEVVEAGSVEAVDDCKAAPTIANDNAYVCGNDGTNGAMAVVEI